MKKNTTDIELKAEKLKSDLNESIQKSQLDNQKIS